AEAAEGDAVAAPAAGPQRPGVDQVGHVRPEQAGDRRDRLRLGERHAEGRRPLGDPAGADPLPEPARAGAEAEQGSDLRLEGDRLVAVVVDPDLAAAVRAAVRVLDLPDEPGPGRRLEGDVVRQVAREADDAGLAED